MNGQWIVIGFPKTWLCGQIYHVMNMHSQIFSIPGRPHIDFPLQFSPRSWIPGAAAPRYWQSASCLDNQILAVHHICICRINQYFRYNRNIYNIPCSLHNNYNKCESLSIFKQNPFHRMVNRRLMRKCDFINWIPIRSFDSTFLSFNIFSLFNYKKNN